MLLETYELTGKALDWAVAKAQGFSYEKYEDRVTWINAKYLPQHWQPSTNWNQCGQLIDELKISVMHVEDDDPYPIEDGPWTAAVPNAEYGYTGPTALIAICRCYVQHKLGDEIEIPDALLKV